MRRWQSGASSVTSRRLVAEWFSSMRRSFAIGFANLSPTSLCIIPYFVTRIQREHKDALYHFNFTMVCTAGKKTKETAPSADTRLETTAVVHRAAMPEPEEEPTTCENKLFNSERQHFYMHFLSMIDRQLVTDQSPFNCNVQSPKIHQLITDRSQTVIRLSPYLQQTVTTKLLINCWQVAKLILNHTLIPNTGIRWLHWSQRSPVNHNKISHEKVISRSQCLCNHSLRLISGDFSFAWDFITFACEQANLLMPQAKCMRLGRHGIMLENNLNEWILWTLSWLKSMILFLCTEDIPITVYSAVTSSTLRCHGDLALVPPPSGCCYQICSVGLCTVSQLSWIPGQLHQSSSVTTSFWFYPL